MSATTFNTVPARREHLGTDVTLLNVIRSEWTKLWSLRSTRWSMGVALVFMAGLGPLISAVTMARWGHMSHSDRASFNAINAGVGGYHVAQLAIGVLGVLVITGEYGTGMIRSSLMAVPRRLPVLAAKIIVFSTVSFVLLLIAAFIGFFASQAIVSGRTFDGHALNVSISTAPALRVVIGSVLYMVVTGIFCTALGTIIRSTAGGISAYVGLLFVLTGLVEILPKSLGDSINPYMPENAGGGIAMAIPDPHTFSPWGGFALFCGYTLVLLAVAVRVLKSQDA